MLHKELQAAIELARSAGEVIMEYYALDIIAEQKLGVDNFYEPVTAADRAASKLIVDGLAAAFPDDAILSEEELDDPHHRLSRQRVWIIDPIDGTGGFVEKNGDFAVQIGLADYGKPVLGVVFLPSSDELFYATAGHGAFSVESGDRPRQITVSATNNLSDMNMAVSRHHRSPKMSQIAMALGVRKEVRRGSVGLKVGLIADRICDLYIHLSSRSKAWDTCAPQVILEEAGGRMTDLFGGDLRYDLHDLQNHNGILASNGVVHERVLRRLAPVLNRIGRKPHRVRAAGAKDSGK